MRCFSFVFPNASTKLKEYLPPSKDLLNIASGTEEVDNVLTQNDYFPIQKDIKDKIDEYKSVPEKNFVNESYFLYDKSNLILNTFITALNKKISIHGSFIYFIRKAPNEMLTLIAAEYLLKILVEKDKIRNNLSFQLTNISGNITKIKASKIYNFSITRLCRKRKLPTQEPIETIIVRAQQNFDIVGELNPIKIEIEDDRILNALKKIQKYFV